MKKILILALFITLQVNASVWDATQNWNDKTINAWETWIQSAALQKDFFMKPGPWQGLKLDCADTIYALRIIFSFENHLPFKISSGATNQSSLFDKYARGPARVRAFINSVADNNGAFELAEGDSYPIKILDIKSGDLYLTEWFLNNNSVRHSHLIKSVSPFGYFHLLFGTTPAQNRNMGEIRGMPLTSIPGAPWGFRRFKLPGEYGRIPSQSSNEQYGILKQVGTDHFFEEIHRLLEREQEGIGARIDRQMKNLCDIMTGRIDIVNEAQVYSTQIAGRCFNAKEFDLYSTTVRDSRLESGIKMLIDDWKILSTEGGYHEASLSYQMAMDSLLGTDRSDYAREQLLQFCNVSIQDKKLDIRDFYELYNDKKISSHPNDTIAARWGQEALQNRCPSYY